MDTIKTIEQMIETLKYYASVCEEDDQPTPSKKAMQAGLQAIAEADEKMRELCAHHNKIGYKQGYRAGQLEEREKVEKQEPVAYVPYGVFDAWLDQAWLGVKCLNPQLCDPDKVDVQPIYAYPKPLREPLSREVIERDFHGRVDFLRQVEAAHGIKETP